MQGFGKHVVLLALAAVAVSGAQAQSGNKQGPRTSVSVDTVCSLNKVNATFNVELRVRDKSSKLLGATVSGYEVSPLAKVATGNWKGDNQMVFTTPVKVDGVPQTVPPGSMITIPASFSLCENKDINPIVGGSKGLNASSKTTYNDGTVMNMCSDDLNTLDVVEPAGIKLSASDINDIANVCKSLP